jgi:phosphocarrier protein FPr/phosphocarrier protein
MSRVSLGAPVAGWLTNVRDVPDPVFADEMMGVGVAIDPTEGGIVAPCAAEVIVVAPTAHSVTLRADNGAEILIHVGLDTVALKGRGFEAHVAAGIRVAAGDPLITFDLDLVALEAKSLVTPVILTNPDAFDLALDPLGRLVAAGDAIGALVSKTEAPRSAPATGEAREAQCTVGFAHGLHARPAARIADTAKRFSSDIAVVAGTKRASARSPVALMALNVAGGARVTLAATGEDAEAALAAVSALVERGDDELRPDAPVAPAQTLGANELGGVSALPGVVVGTAFRWHRNLLDTPEQGQGVDHETAALAEARDAVAARLRALAVGTRGPGGEIAKAHLGIVEDEEISAAAAAAITEGKSAGRAWSMATEQAAGTLEATGNPMLRERIADLRDVSGQLIAVIQGTQAMAPPDLPKGAILVADDLMPSELLSLDRTRLAGIAIGGGGPTSHVAIIAASFGVPTLVAIGPELSRVQDGAQVLLDASAGKLVLDPDENARSRATMAAATVDSARETATGDGERVRLLANLGGLEDVEPALAAGAEGCGLLRTEFLFLDRDSAPSEEEQRNAYQAIADALAGRPLTIRTLDIGGDKPVGYISFPPEQNPALGLRGIRTRLIKPELIDEQLRAIAAVSGDAIKVMIPMVSSVEELRGVRERLAVLGSAAKVGVMVETPAAALIADGLAAEADFLSIGSNDLAQYALAMDRTNPLLAGAIDALHPAVLRLIAMTAEAGRKAGKSVSLCGNLASDPIGALLLIGVGIRELSAVPAALPAVRRAIARASTKDCRALAERALALESAAQVRALAAELLNAPTQGEQA